MKKFIVIGVSVVALLGLAAAPSLAASPYLAANLGLVMLDDAELTVPGFGSGEISYDPGVGVTVAVGAVLVDNTLRAEGELGYRLSDVEEGNADMSAMSLMGNIYLDLPTGSPVMPFLGAGIGVANVELEIDGAGSGDDTVFAYQVAAGVGFMLNAQTTLDLQYRYFATEDPNLEGVEAEYSSHNVMVGARFNF